ncbi:MAG: hypothetical protein JO013_13820 [Alphaproteobacteria bacterium]|nr:hypothetical protein [Alphaproteobacteria bacterium]
MARDPDEMLVRAEEMFRRFDSRTSDYVRDAGRRYGPTARGLARRAAGLGAGLVALAVATVAFAMIVGPIGLTGLFVVSILALAILFLVGMMPSEPKRVAYTEELPTKIVVRQLSSLLSRERAALPAPAARRADAIGATLPLLEQRLADLDPLDPIAADARRLMGKHLPDLIDRYERVPPAYRQEKDGEGMTVDERLVASLDAAKTALDDVADRLSRSDREAFETQGRFIESRYKDPA